MLIKTGDAQILEVVDPKSIEDEENRKKVLANALDKSKKAEPKKEN